MRISCPDATGLGCDIARLLLDFGLRIMDGELAWPPGSCLHRVLSCILPLFLGCCFQACLPDTL